MDHRLAQKRKRQKNGNQQKTVRYKRFPKPTDEALPPPAQVVEEISEGLFERLHRQGVIIKSTRPLPFEEPEPRIITHRTGSWEDLDYVQEKLRQNRREYQASHPGH